MTLPAALALPPPMPDAKLASPGKERVATVLVVDDEPAIGMALRRILRGHEVTVFATVKEALELLASGKQFDVIFSDLMMPQMTGMDFYHELKRRSPDDAARMVFVTGGAFTPVAAEFLDQIGNERIEKPFSPAAVRDLVQQFSREWRSPVST